MKNLLRKLLISLVSSKDETSNYKIRPFARNGSIVYYDKDNVLTILDDPSLPSDYRRTFEQVIDQMVIFEAAELIPIAIHDMENQIINITSRELLEGKFIQ